MEVIFFTFLKISCKNYMEHFCYDDARAVAVQILVQLKVTSKLDQAPLSDRKVLRACF